MIPSGVTPCTTPAAGVGPGATGRLDCNFTNVRTRTNGAWSVYHGLQNELRIRNWHNFTANFAYTWSKAMDNTSEIFSATTGGISNPAPQNPFDPNIGERAVSAQSFPHVFTTYWIYDLPWMKSQKGLLGHILGGWSWSGTYRFQSGAPLTFYSTTLNPACDSGWNNAFIGTDSCRPIVSNPGAPLFTSGRFVDATRVVNNTTCISTGTGLNAVGTATCPTINPTDVHFILNSIFADNALCSRNPFTCSVGRDTVRGQTQNNVDMSVAKGVKLTERVNMSLRFDAFNVLNRMYYGSPGVNISSRRIDAPTGASPSSFGNLQFNSTSTSRRSAVISAHVDF